MISTVVEHERYQNQLIGDETIHHKLQHHQMTLHGILQSQ